MVTSTIGAIGRDYATITLWEAGGRSSGDVGECYNDGVFAESVLIDAIDSLTLRAASGEEHNGSASSGVRIIPSGAGHGIQVEEDGFLFEDIEIGSGTGTSDECIRFGGTTNTNTTAIKRCIFNTSASAQADALYCEVTWTTNVENCFFIAPTRNAVNASNGGATTWTLTMDQCTIYGAGNDAIENFDTGTFNCNLNGVLVHAVGNALKDSGSAGAFTLNDCILSDGTGTSIGAAMTNVLESKTFTTSTAASAVILAGITAGSEDFHLINHANNIAQNHVAAIRTTTTDDIDRAARPDGVTHDAGGDEFVLFTATLNSAYGAEGEASLALPPDSSGGAYGSAGTGILAEAYG